MLFLSEQSNIYVNATVLEDVLDEEQEKEGKNVHKQWLAGLESVKDKEDPVYQQLKERLYREYKIYNHIVTKG